MPLTKSILRKRGDTAKEDDDREIALNKTFDSEGSVNNKSTNANGTEEEKKAEDGDAGTDRLGARRAEVRKNQSKLESLMKRISHKDGQASKEQTAKQENLASQVKELETKLAEAKLAEETAIAKAEKVEASLQAQKSKSQNKIVELKTYLSEVTQLAQTASARVAKAEEEKAEVEARLTKKIKELEEVNMSLRVKTKDIVKQSAQAADKMIGTAHKDAERAEEARKEAEIKVAELTAKLSEVTELSKLATERTAATETEKDELVQSLNAQLEDLQTVNDSLQERLQEMENESTQRVEALEKLLSEAQREANLAEKARKKSERRVEEVENQLIKTREKLENARIELNLKDYRAKDLMAEVEKLAGKVGAAEFRSDESRKKLNALEQKRKNAQEEKEAYELRIKELETEVEKLQYHLEQHVSGVNNSVDQVQRQQMQTMEMLEAQRKESNSMMQRLHDQQMEELRSSVMNEKSLLEKKVWELEMQLTESKAMSQRFTPASTSANEEMESELKNLRNKLEDVIGQLQQKGDILKSKESICREQNALIEDLKLRVSNRDDTIMRLTEQYNQSRAEISSFNRDGVEQQNRENKEIAELKEQVIVLKTKLMERETSVDARSDICREQAAQISDLTSKLSETERRLDVATRVTDFLQKYLAELEEERIYEKMRQES